MISFSKRLSFHTPTQSISDENKVLAFQEYEIEDRHYLREHDDTKREADAHMKQQAGHERGNARRPLPHQHRQENQFKQEGSIREPASACRAEGHPREIKTRPYRLIRHVVHGDAVDPIGRLARAPPGE